MGLSKEFNHRGLTAKDGYHRISRIVLVNDRASVVVGSYATKEASDNGEPPLEKNEINVHLSEIEETKASFSYEVAYNKIVKPDVRFEDATDVIE